MKSNHKNYEFTKSLERMDTILDPGSPFEDKDTIPKREDLTYINGYYVNCSSLFIDLRGSSQLPKIHQKRVLAKIYRAYISEMVAIINGSTLCKEINIVGDCVSAIFETPYKYNMDEVFSLACDMNALIDILNYKLEKKGYKPIKAGIGLAYGRVLMIKAGYNGSGINDIVWMGDAVNQASKMCGKQIKKIHILL
ncbi:adenylate/guanylate cyclase domain-containing protein [Bacillus cereus]|uniref:adenylate/guanylate cyclase domain-containing protein n=1 Tax=Bacillus cereus TaxID=1396 RepID=UPI001C3EA1A1|nr:adenylate/guanylate cyclase domain-containing protein [Bacillus cereus]